MAVPNIANLSQVLYVPDHRACVQLFAVMVLFVEKRDVMMEINSMVISTNFFKVYLIRRWVFFRLLN